MRNRPRNYYNEALRASQVLMIWAACSSPDEFFCWSIMFSVCHIQQFLPAVFSRRDESDLQTIAPGTTVLAIEDDPSRVQNPTSTALLQRANLLSVDLTRQPIQMLQDGANFLLSNCNYTYDNTKSVYNLYAKYKEGIERLSQVSTITDVESVLEDITCDEDTISVLLDLLQVWINNPQIKLSSLQTWSGRCNIIHALPYLLRFQDKRSHMSSSMQILFREESKSALKNLIKREFIAVLCRKDYCMYASDANFIDVATRNQRLQADPESNMKRPIPLFDDSILDLMDMFLDEAFVYLQQHSQALYTTATVNTTEDPDAFNASYIQSINVFREFMNPILRCVIALNAKPPNRNIHGIDGSKIIIGVVEKEFLDFLFDVKPDLLGRMIRNQRFTATAGSMVARICSRLLVHEQIVKDFSTSISNPLLFGMSRIKVTRLNNAHRRILWSSDFYANIFRSCATAFPDMNLYELPNNPQIDLQRAIIRDVFKVFFVSSHYPKALYTSDLVRQFSQLQEVPLQAKHVQVFAMEDLFQLFFLWTRLPSTQTFMSELSHSHYLQLFYAYPTEILYWNYLYQCGDLSSSDVLHRDMLRLVTVWTKNVCRLESDAPSVPLELLQMSRYFIRRSNMPRGYQESQADTQNFWRLCFYFSNTLQPLADDFLLAKYNWRSQNISVLLDHYFSKNIHLERRVYYHLFKRYHGHRAIEDLVAMLGSEDDTIMRGQLSLLQDIVGLFQNREPISLNASFYPDEIEDPDPYAIVVAQQPFTSIDPVKFISLMIVFVQLQKVNLQRFSRVHSDVMSRWIARHTYSYFPELSQEGITEPGIRRVIPDILSDLLSAQGTESLIIIHKLMAKRQILSIEEYLVFCVDEFLMGYVQKNRVFLRHFYKRHTKLTQAMLTIFLQRVDLFASIGRDGLTQQDKRHFLINCFEALLEEEHHKDVETLLHKVKLALQSSSDPSLLYRTYDCIGVLARLWQKPNFVNRFDFLRSDPCTKAIMRDRILKLSHEGWGLKNNHIDKVKFFSDHAVEYVETLSELSKPRLILASASLARLEGCYDTKMPAQEVTKILLGFFAASPTIINKILSQLKAGSNKTNRIREHLSDKAIEGLLHWVRNDESLSSHEKRSVSPDNLKPEDLAPTKDLIKYLVSNIPHHPESYSSEAQKNPFKQKNDVDFMREVVEKFHYSPILGWNMCLDIITLPYGSTDEANRKLNKYFETINACAKDKDGKGKLLLNLFARLLMRSWIVPDIAKDCIESLFTKTGQAKWYASLAQILLSCVSLFLAIFSKPYRKELRRNCRRLVKSCGYFIVSPLIMFVSDPVEFFRSTLYWIFLPFKILSYSIKSAIHTIGRIVLNVFRAMLGVFWPSYRKKIEYAPLKKTLENLLSSILGLAISTAVVLHVVGFLSLTFVHFKYAVCIATITVTCSSLMKWMWPESVKVSHSITDNEKNSDPITSYDLVSEVPAVAIDLEDKEDAAAHVGYSNDNYAQFSQS
ncbi:MAG: hypothetical protein VX112_04430 [Pseudomonadota bacterium]|nr:hypothetical protein [Pseudomonadota bacterium]